MRALHHVSAAIRSKLNHFNAHVRQLHIHPEGGRKRHIQCRSCQNMGRSKSLESQTTIPNWAHGDPDIAHFINTFLKTCRRTPWTTSDPIPVIYLLWAQPIWTRRHCYRAITPDTGPSLCGWSLQLTLFKISHYFNPYGRNFLYPARPQHILFMLPLSRFGALFSPTVNVFFHAAIPDQSQGWNEESLSLISPYGGPRGGFQSPLGSRAFVLAPCLP